MQSEAKDQLFSEASDLIPAPKIPQNLPQTYFDLIEKVGSGGRYQFMLLLLFSMTWFVTGIILMSTAFLFLNPSFNCDDFGLMVGDCDAYVCSLPKKQWSAYVPDSQKQFLSIANAFDEYYCQDQIYLELTSTFTYFGAFLGYAFMSFFSDNFGRKRSLVLSWGICTVGLVLLSCSVNLYMAAVGLFMAGFGCDSAINIGLYIVGQVVENSKRQSYSVFMMSFFCIGSLVVSAFYYWLEDWRLVTIFVVTAPCVITFIIIVLYLEETPLYLLKLGMGPSLRALNRIGKINKGKADVISEQDIENVLSTQQTQQYNKIITMVDLFRFPSLRLITITTSLIFFAIYAMYYGPILIIDSIGFDIYTSNVVVNVADLATYIPCYFWIERIPRKLLGMILMGIATVTAGILIFVEKPDDCEFCSQAVIEIVLIFIFRFCISMEFSVFIIFTTELYPARARAIGNGFINCAGTIASTVSPILLGVLERAEINNMILFTILGIIGVGNYTLLNETMGLPMKDEIDEIEMQKEKKRSKIGSIHGGSQISSERKQSNSNSKLQ